MEMFELNQGTTTTPLMLTSYARPRRWKCHGLHPAGFTTASIQRLQFLSQPIEYQWRKLIPQRPLIPSLASDSGRHDEVGYDSWVVGQPAGFLVCEADRVDSSSAGWWSLGWAFGRIVVVSCPLTVLGELFSAICMYMRVCA